MPLVSRMDSAPGVDSKDAGDDGFFRAVANHVGGGFAAHEEGKRVHENGFAGASFAGEKVQPRTERGDGMIDHGVVFSAQFDKHGIRAQHSMKNRV